MEGYLPSLGEEPGDLICLVDAEVADFISLRGLRLEVDVELGGLQVSMAEGSGYEEEIMNLTKRIESRCNR